MDTYTPSTYIQEVAEKGNLWPCKNLSALVAAAAKLGYTASLDFDPESEDGEEIVTSKTVRRAVHEVDEAWVYFWKDGKRDGSVWVIPSNDEDWLSDYTVTPWLDKLIQKVVY